MVFSLLIEESEYMEWIESIHALTLNFIGNPLVPMIILQNFLEFWSTFSYYASKGDKKEYIKLKKMMLDIALAYLNAQCEIANNTNFLEEIFENESTIHDYMKYLALISKPKF